MSHRLKVFCLLGTLSLSGLVLRPTLADAKAVKPQFTAVDLGTLPNFTDSVAAAINDKGQVIGWTDSIQVAAGAADTNAERGFLWENGKMTDLSPQSCRLSLWKKYGRIRDAYYFR